MKIYLVVILFMTFGVAGLANSGASLEHKGINLNYPDGVDISSTWGENNKVTWHYSGDFDDLRELHISILKAEIEYLDKSLAKERIYLQRVRASTMPHPWPAEEKAIAELTARKQLLQQTLVKLK